MSADGRLTLLDAQRTGNVVDGMSGTAKALAFYPAQRTLFVLHAFGPDHLRLISVDDEGQLTARPKRYQLYGNAAKLVGYAIQSDGSLDEITSAGIPYNSSQGLTGF